MVNGHRPRSPMEVEADLDRVTLALDDAVGEYESILSDAAAAEADYREVEARSFVALADIDNRKVRGERMTVPEREARVRLMSLDEYRVFLILDARAKARREYLSTLRTQVAALQTLAANRRQLG